MLMRRNGSRSPSFVVMGIIVALFTSGISASHEEMLQRLHGLENRLKDIVTVVEDIEDELAASIIEDGRPARGTTKRQTLHGFSAARGKRLDEQDDLDLLMSPGDEQKRQADHWPTSRGHKHLSADFFLKRGLWPEQGFSAARGKRFNPNFPQLRPDFDQFERDLVMFDPDYKRMAPPKGFSSARGKRHYDLPSYPLTPPPRGGFISVRGKKHGHLNPLLRHIYSNEINRKRAPPTGFSHSRGKKSITDLSDILDGLKGVERGRIYSEMSRRLMSAGKSL